MIPSSIPVGELARVLRIVAPALELGPRDDFLGRRRLVGNLSDDHRLRQVEAGRRAIGLVQTDDGIAVLAVAPGTVEPELVAHDSPPEIGAAIIAFDNLVARDAP